jgi:hypothetical protein
MRRNHRILWLAFGIFLGLFIAEMYSARTRPALAGNDRHDDYILCTGPVSVQPAATTDGVWLLDYRSGKLLGTVVDRGIGKIINWAEVDLVTEFGLQPKQNVHFMMTTGTITHGQAALYVAETSTGRFGIYTMGPRPDGRPGIAIRRHDLSVYRAPAGK